MGYRQRHGHRHLPWKSYNVRRVLALIGINLCEQNDGSLLVRVREGGVNLVIDPANIQDMVSGKDYIFTGKAANIDSKVKSLSYDWQLGDAATPMTPLPGKVGPTATIPLTYRFPSQGAYEVTLTLYDTTSGTPMSLAKATSLVSGVTLSIKAPEDPELISGKAYTFTGSASLISPQVKSLAYEWDFEKAGDLTPFPGPAVPSVTIPGTHTFANDGVYRVKLRLYDTTSGAKTLLSQASTEVVIASRGVTLSIEPSVTSVSADQEVGFTGTAAGIGPEVKGLRYEWDFGDGGSTKATLDSVSASVTIDGRHSFSSAENYTVKLTLYDTTNGANRQIAEATAAVTTCPNSSNPFDECNNVTNVKTVTTSEPIVAPPRPIVSP